MKNKSVELLNRLEGYTTELRYIMFYEEKKNCTEFYLNFLFSISLQEINDYF